MVQLYKNHWKTIDYNGTLTKTINYSIVLKIWPSLWSISNQEVDMIISIAAAWKQLYINEIIWAMSVWTFCWGLLKHRRNPLKWPQHSFLLIWLAASMYETRGWEWGDCRGWADRGRLALPIWGGAYMGNSHLEERRSRFWEDGKEVPMSRSTSHLTLTLLLNITKIQK